MAEAVPFLPPSRHSAGYVGRLAELRLWAFRQWHRVLRETPPAWGDAFPADALGADAAAPAGDDAIVAWLDTHRPSGVRHFTGTFFEHLSACRSILETWGEPPRTRLTGLLHSIYSTEAFPRPLVSWSRRDVVRDLVGPRIEALVFCVCTMAREAFVKEVISRAHLKEPVPITHYRTGEQRLVEREATLDLALFEAAHLAELTCDLTTGAPAPWLYLVSRINRSAAAYGRRIGPLKERAPAVRREAEERSIVQYGEGIERARRGAWAEAVESLEACSKSNPLVAEPLAILAHVYGRLGERTLAAERAAAARALFEAWGTAWDKRLRFVDWQARAAAGGEWA